MKAIRISGIGERLTQTHIAIPIPAAGEVLVAVRAAGICHSDAHYRSGIGSLRQLPITPGHEVAGIVESVGAGVSRERVGKRVCLHYLVTCGKCSYCRGKIGQFCPDVAMIGKDRDGGYAEYICVPEQNAFMAFLLARFRQRAPARLDDSLRRLAESVFQHPVARIQRGQRFA